MGKTIRQENRRYSKMMQDPTSRKAIVDAMARIESKTESMYRQIGDSKLIDEARSDSRRQRDIYLESLERYENMDGGLADTYGCDRIFASFFVQSSEDMSADFPYILKDFLNHEYQNLEKYGHEHYVNVEDCESTVSEMLANIGMNMMMNAVVGGSQYTKALLAYLHKTYYRDEHKILKRFKRLNRDDIELITGYDKLYKNENEIPDDAEFDTTIKKMARIVFISRLNGIEIDADCAYIFATLDMICDNFTRKYRHRDWIRERTGSLYPDCAMQTNICFTDNKMAGLDAFSERVASACIKWLGFEPEQFMGRAEDTDYPGTARIDRATALLILKIAFPEKTQAGEEYSEQQVAYAYQMLKQTRATVSLGALRPYGILSAFFPGYGDDRALSVRSVPKLFDSSKIVFSSQEVMPEKPKDNTEIAEDQDEKVAMRRQINELRIKLHVLEEDNKALREGYEGIRSIKEENRNFIAKMNELNAEASALRSYVYGLTEDDVEEPPVDIDEMKKELREKKVVIIGGHPKWVQKLRAELPEWKFIGAAVSGAADPGIVEGMDYVYFFSDTLSHATYYKYLNILREKGTRFGYIHGVNITKNITHFYKEMILSAQ